jgi:hypothetical protein
VRHHWKTFSDDATYWTFYFPVWNWAIQTEIKKTKFLRG